MDLAPVAAHDPRAISDAEREAAVLVPIIDRRSGPHVLFTKRTEHLSDHPGQMSFPGGGRERYDRSLESTALREAAEEIGLFGEEADIVGRLDDIYTVTGFSIRPFVARIPDREYVPSDREVADIAVLAVADLIDVDNYRRESRDHPQHGPIQLHYFHVDGYTVWGATARILVQLLELTTDWQRPDSEDSLAEPDDVDAVSD
jgi:8-oxo-dGTP pyrophosphatase MutT (NUDIX family)